MNPVRPNPDFDHVILTRFSVRFPDSPPIDEDWLAYRWGFFRDALAASMARQTENHFHWLVFFDIDTPDWLRAEIDELSPGLFTPVYVSSWSPRVAQMAVADASASPYLITTRIDSDDAIARQFVADVQSHFDRQQSLYINFLCGVQVERTGEVYRYDEPLGPFISYVEERVESALPRTVFYNLRHGLSRRFGDVLNVVGPPRWMQIIHGSNIANGVRGLRARPEAFEADFDIDLPFDRAISAGRYRRERARSVIDLVRLWFLYPYYAREFAVARQQRRAGTRVLPMTPGVAAPTESRLWTVPGVTWSIGRLRRLESVRRLRRNRLQRSAERIKA